jgi:hypothetical protein
MTFAFGFILGLCTMLFLVILLKGFVEYYKWKGRKILDLGESILKQKIEIEKQLKEINNG